MDGVKMKEFYDREYLGERYANVQKAEAHPFYGTLKPFIDRNQLQQKRCLEVGCGRGAFQDLVPDYVGVDISFTAGAYLHKHFVQCSATELTFADSAFDAAWTYAVLEHVPEPEIALQELRRVIKDQGRLLFAPAWQCRPWTAKGYQVRSFGELNWAGKMIKASIPIRDSVVFRSSYIFPRRMLRLASYCLKGAPMNFKYRQLVPNYGDFLLSDSDAVNSMDPFEAILWFTSRGDGCVSHPDRFSQFFVRSGALEFEIHKA